MAAPWIAAPRATHRSGSTSPRGAMPKVSSSRRWTSGVRVAPPTSRISSTCGHRQVGALQRHVDGIQRFLDERPDQILVDVAVDLHRQVDGLAVRLGQVFLLDQAEGVHRQPLLRVLRRPRDAGHRPQVVGEIDTLLDPEMIEDMPDQLGVEIVAAQVVVAVAGDDLDHAVLNADDRHVEGAAAQIVDDDALALVLSGLVGQRRRGRLVEDADGFQPGDLPRFAGGLTLRVGEVGRHGDDRLADRLAQARPPRSP